MSSHCSPRTAIANCGQWYIIFCIFSIFLNKLELVIFRAIVGKMDYLDRMDLKENWYVHAVLGKYMKELTSSSGNN